MEQNGASRCDEYTGSGVGRQPVEGPELEKPGPFARGGTNGGDTDHVLMPACRERSTTPRRFGVIRWRARREV